MSQELLSDGELKAIAADLNRFEPARVRAVLDEVGERPVPGDRPNATASGPLNFGSVPAGVLVYRMGSGSVRLRLTVTEITGASYEEFELSDAGFARLAHAAVERLDHPR